MVGHHIPWIISFFGEGEGNKKRKQILKGNIVRDPSDKKDSSDKKVQSDQGEKEDERALQVQETGVI